MPKRYWMVIYLLAALSILFIINTTTRETSWPHYPYGIEELEINQP